MKFILIFLLSFSALAVSPSLVIGDLDWFPVDELEDGPAKELSKGVGVLNVGSIVCTAWVWNDVVYTAKHCLDNSRRAEFVLNGVSSILTFSVCPRGRDICSTGSTDSIFLPRSLREIGRKDRKEAYLLHVQEEVVLISPKCSYVPFATLRFLHDCDSWYGSSGGMLVDANTHTPVGVHNGGFPDTMTNTATSLEALTQE